MQQATMARSAMMKLGRAPVCQDITIGNVNTRNKIFELMREMSLLRVQHA